VTSSGVAFAGISELALLLRRRKATSVELTKFYLNRLDTLGRELNATVTVMHDRALREAAAADKELRAGRDRGPLHGIPCGVKDLLAAIGAPTTWGAQPFRSQVLDFDATLVRRLNSAGAVLLGKLAMIELAGGMGYNQADASFTGPCRNPWNPAYWTGGSSSGPGAAVSAGLVPFAIGSETDGSIMNPSSFCGCTGLRPTYGRVSRHGAMALCWTLDKLGPMCRSAADARLVLSAIAGHDPNDPSSSAKDVDLADVRRDRWRFATIRHGADKIQPGVKRNFEASLAVVRELGAVDEIELPKFPYDAMVGAIISAEGGAAFRGIIEDGRILSLRDPDGRRGGYSSLVVYAVDYVDAMRERRKLRAAFAALFERYDAIVAPGESSVAFPIGVAFDKAYPGVQGSALTTAANLIGAPAIALPNGFGLHGLPTSVMFVAAPFAENSLITLGQRLQAKTGWHRNHPPIAAAR